MLKSKNAITAGYHLTLKHPGLWLFAFLTLIGGILNISLILLNIFKNILIFNLWFQYRGLFVVPRISAMALGIGISLLIVFFIASFAKSVLIQVTSLEYYEKKDIWYGSFKKALNALSVNFRISVSFYVFSLLALIALYESIIFIVKSIPYSVFGYWFWLSLIILIATLIVCVFGIISIYASNFATIFKLKYFKSIFAAWDLFLIKPLESLWFLIKILIIGAALFLATLLVYSLGLFVFIKIAIFMGNSLLAGSGLISLSLIVIIYLLLILFYSLTYSSWTYFFLGNVGGIKITEKSAEFEMSRNTAIQGTLNNV
jgi:hypothetical protein